MRCYCEVRIVELILLSENKDTTGKIVSLLQSRRALHFHGLAFPSNWNPTEIYNEPIYVDDMLMIGNKEIIEELKTEVEEVLSIKTKDNLTDY